MIAVRNKISTQMLVGLLGLLGLAAGLTASPSFAQQTLRIGIEGEYPPFNEIDKSGKLQGFDVEVSNALCEEMQIKCNFVIQAWDGIIPALIANKFDLIISSVAITDKRREAVAFSKPYYLETAIFVGPRGADLKTTTEGLKGKSIGVQRATTFEKMLKEKWPGVTVKVYGAVSDHNLDLANGRLDAVLGSRLVMSDWLKSADGKNFEIKGQPFLDVKYMGQGAGIAVRKNDAELLKNVNAALDAINKNGKFEAINKKYFPFSIAP